VKVVFNIDRVFVDLFSLRSMEHYMYSMLSNLI